MTTETTAVPWGVGMYETPASRSPWVIGAEEMHRDIGAAPGRLATFGVGAGERVLFCSMLSEAGQFWPLIVGTMLGGAQLSCADATEAEAARVAMFLRHMRYRAVIGVSSAILDGLDERGLAYDGVFDGVAVVAARPGAYERLRTAGVAAHRCALCGPAVAIAPAPDAPAEVDAGEWRLDTGDDGHVRVSNLRPRHTTFERVATAVVADVIDGKACTWPSAR